MNKILSIIKTIVSEFLKANLKTFLNSILTTLGFVSKLNIYTLRNGVRLKFAPGTLDVMVIRECLLSNLYTRFISKKNLDIVLDLGCQKGYFITGLLSNKVKIKKAVCVDPLAENLKVFKENIILNKNLYKRGIKILFEPSAVFIKNGKKIFYVTGNSVNHSLKNPSKYDKVIKKLIVNTVTIKSLFDKYKLQKIDLVKIDIEGAEFDLFRSKDIGQLLNTRYLVMEIHPDKKNKTSELIKILESFNFEIKYPNNAYKSFIFASKKSK
jgi:FkbM family methyltransferase